MTKSSKLSKKDYGLLVELIRKFEKSKSKSGKAGNKVGKSNKMAKNSNKTVVSAKRSQKYSNYMKRVRSLVTEHTKWEKLPVGTRKRIRKSYVTVDDVKRLRKLGIPTARIDRMFPSVHGSRRYRSDKVYKARSKGKSIEERINKANNTAKRGSSVAKTRKAVMESKIPTNEKAKILTDLERKDRELYKKGYEHGAKHAERRYNRRLNTEDKNLAEAINVLFAE